VSLLLLSLSLLLVTSSPLWKWNLNGFDDDDIGGCSLILLLELFLKWKVNGSDDGWWLLKLRLVLFEVGEEVSLRTSIEFEFGFEFEFEFEFGFGFGRGGGIILATAEAAATLAVAKFGWFIKFKPLLIPKRGGGTAAPFGIKGFVFIGKFGGGGGGGDKFCCNPCWKEKGSMEG